MKTGRTSSPAEKAVLKSNLATVVLRSSAETGVLIAGLILLFYLPWYFGGVTVLGGKILNWTGFACGFPLLLHWIANFLEGKTPRLIDFLPIFCWGVLAVIITLSISNPSSQMIPPWNGSHFKPLEHQWGVPSSGFPQMTRILGIRYIAFAVIVLTTFTVGLPLRWLRVLLGLFVVNGVIMGLAGIPFKYSGERLVLGHWPTGEWYFYSSFAYHNHWGAYAVLCLGAVAALVLSTPNNTLVRLAAFPSAAILLGTTLVATSRLGAIIQICFIGLVAIYAFRKWIWLRQVKRWSLVALFIAGAACVVGMIVWQQAKGQGPGGHRTWAALITQNPFASRLHLLEDTLPMIAAKPVYGWGLGAYRAGFRLYQRPETRIVYNEGRITLYDHAHNDWLQMVAELGFLGALLLCFPLAVLVARARAALVQSDLQKWVFAGCVAFLVMAWAESLFLNRALAGAFFFLFGIGLHCRPQLRAPADLGSFSNYQGKPEV